MLHLAYMGSKSNFSREDMYETLTEHALRNHKMPIKTWLEELGMPIERPRSAEHPDYAALNWLIAACDSWVMVWEKELIELRNDATWWKPVPTSWGMRRQRTTELLRRLENEDSTIKKLQTWYDDGGDLQYVPIDAVPAELDPEGAVKVPDPTELPKIRLRVTEILAKLAGSATTDHVRDAVDRMSVVGRARGIRIAETRGSAWATAAGKLRDLK